MAESLTDQVLAARSGDAEAYGRLVRRFQAMAVGYAFSILGDFGEAEDAAQEAFVEAYRALAGLREPRAFGGWLRRIVVKQCDRIMRTRRVATVPLDSVADPPSKAPTPRAVAEQNELRDQVLAAIRSLPDGERTATTLYYIDGYSQNEVGEFLGVPASTVKSRLHAARGKLRERMTDMVEKTLKEGAPDDGFAQTVVEEVRDMKSPHLPEMAKMFHEVFAEDCKGEYTEGPAGEVGWDKDAPATEPFFAEILAEPTGKDGRRQAQLFVAERGGKTAGLLQIFYHYRPKGLISWVDLLGASPPFRGKGIESGLLDRAISATRELSSAYELRPLGVVSLAGRDDPHIVEAFEKAGGQVRTDLVYRTTPDEEDYGPILWLPMASDLTDISTKSLVWELWQFGGLPREWFVEQYGEPTKI